MINQVMANASWFDFFTTCNEILGNGSATAQLSDNWCAWTTFDKLQEDCLYWRSGLPNAHEFAVSHIKDGGVWGQPFNYDEIAHIILPAKFYWESRPGPNWECGYKEQNIKALAERLKILGVGHRLTDIVLEIKIY